jgi:hypothetical protein
MYGTNKKKPDSRSWHGQFSSAPFAQAASRPALLKPRLNQVWAINYHLQRRPADCRQRGGVLIGEFFGTDAQG